MPTRHLFIPTHDKKRLLWLLADEIDKQSATNEPHITSLMAELKRAKTVPTDKVAPDVVTMNSRVVIRDLKTHQTSTYTLVFPDAADDDSKLSILSPIGTAILGYASGDTIQWPGPDGMLRLRIEAIEYQPEAAGDEPPPPPHAIIAGYGVVGRHTAQALEDAGIATTLLEINRATVDTQTALGRRVVHGSATNADDLRAAGIETATALVLTIPDENQAIQACRVAHNIQPGIFIVVRTNFVSKGLTALQHGADHVVIQEVVTAEAMRDVVVKKLFEA